MSRRPPRAPPGRAAARGGFTLLEVAVTSLLVTLLLAGLGPVWRDVNRNYVDARARTAAVQELTLAVMAIAQDMAQAEIVTTQQDQLQIQLTGGQHIVYRIEGERLVRDLPGQNTTTVANSMKSLSTATGTSFPVRVILTASALGRERVVELELGW